MKKVIVFPALLGLIFLCSCEKEETIQPILAPSFNTALNPTYGCTDSTAYNYNLLADADDGSCLYLEPSAGDSL